MSYLFVSIKIETLSPREWFSFHTTTIPTMTYDEKVIVPFEVLCLYLVPCLECDFSTSSWRDVISKKGTVTI